MIALPHPEVIITHESDLDGLMSGVLLQRLARKVFNAEVPLEAYHYNHWIKREPREKSAWVADLTFEARLDKPNWLIVDHHVTDATAQQATLVHDITKSAGTLCYELCCAHGLQSPELDRLTHLNNVSDLFLEEDPQFVLAGDYAALVKVYGFWNLHTLVDKQIERLLDHPLLQVMEVKRRVEDPLGVEWSRRHITELSATVGYVDTVVGSSNQIVHQLLESRATKYPVLVTLFRRGMNVIASFRSRNGEAIRVAEKLQGGGHANASGALLPKSVRNIPEAVEYLKQVLNPRTESASPLNSLESLFAAIEKK
jgi:oligoribonuclease NrnB/cAMP/cGMP phosphodiesterase (DHH superfamily)